MLPSIIIIGDFLDVFLYALLTYRLKAINILIAHTQLLCRCKRCKTRTTEAIASEMVVIKKKHLRAGRTSQDEKCSHSSHDTAWVMIHDK